MSQQPEAGPGNAPDVVIGFPDGTEVSSADPAVHRILPDFAGRDVELQALPALSDRDLYRGNHGHQGRPAFDVRART